MSGRTARSPGAGKSSSFSPPMTGGRWKPDPAQREEFDAAAEAAWITRGRTHIGAGGDVHGILLGCRSQASHRCAHVGHYPGNGRGRNRPARSEEAMVRCAARAYFDRSLTGRIEPGGKHRLGHDRLIASGRKKAFAVAESDGSLKTRARSGSRSKVAPEHMDRGERAPTMPLGGPLQRNRIGRRIAVPVCIKDGCRPRCDVPYWLTIIV